MPIDPEFAAALQSHSMEIDEVIAERLESYVRTLWAWNEKLNLTRHTSWDLFVGRDLRDCLQVAPLLKAGEEVLDERMRRYGDRFDITHAVHRYRFRREWFKHGIGKHTFRTIDRPDMIGPGERGYPPDRTRLQVIGAQIGGETRSYAIDYIVRHEIVNETVGNVQAAVAY